MLERLSWGEAQDVGLGRAVQHLPRFPLLTEHGHPGPRAAAIPEAAAAA